jgi:hypothetical protein
MEKRGYKVGIIFLLLLFLLPMAFSIETSKDFEKQILSAAYYSENYESGNPDYNYAKFLVYLYTTEEEMNSLLRITGDTAITPEEITAIIGKSEETSWVLNEDESSEIQLDKPVPAWLSYLVFDGKTIQIKLNVVPYLFENNKVVYKTKFIINFKQAITSEDVKLRLDEIEKLAKTYALEQTVDNANSLAEKSVNFEVLTEKVFRQSSDLSKTITNLFSEENLVNEKDVVSKEYELYNNGKKLYVSLSTCEKCQGLDGLWINLGFTMKNEKDQEIKYYFSQISTDQYEALGINGIKTELIERNKELTLNLNQKKYAEAFQITKEIEIISEVLNKKINEGGKTQILTNFISASQFYNGLFGGYKLIQTSSYKEKNYQLIIYLKENKNETEVCNNQIDDNSNGKTDCEEEFCSGQVCGTKTIISNESGKEQEKSIDLYCISGECKEKEVPKPSITIPLCGNGICEEGEISSCQKDCGVKCEEYSPIECSGKVIFKGKNENGCSLPPICLPTNDSCTSNSDCAQSLCGKSICVIINNESYGKCELSQLEQCSQPKCTDGEKKGCTNSGVEIITDICDMGSWKSTGEICSGLGNIDQTKELIIKEKSTINQGCISAEDCAGGVCSVGVCTKLPSAKQTIKGNTVVSGLPVIGQGLTGFVIDLGVTGKNVVTGGMSLTGIIPEGDPVKNPSVLAEPDKSTAVKPKIYEPVAKSSSPFSLTGNIKNLDGQEVVVEPQNQNILAKDVKGDRVLPANIKDAFILEGTIKTDKQYNQDISVRFSSSGENFGAISTLINRYRSEGVEWQTWVLNNAYKEDREFSETFCSEDFAIWYEKFLLSQVDISTKKNVIYKLYNENLKRKQEMASLMNGLKLTSLDYPLGSLASTSYKSNFVQMDCKETIKEVNFPGQSMSVQMPVFTTYNTIVSYPSYFLKESYKNALAGSDFPSSSYVRKSNLGLTEEEKIKLKQDTALNKKINELISGTKDGSFDMEISFVSYESGKEELIYNLYVSLSNDGIKIYPMSLEQIPTGLDAKATYDFDKLYTLLEQTEKGSWRYTGFEFDKGINPKKQFKLVLDYIQMQSKIRDVKNSLIIESSADQNKIKDMLMDFTLNVFGDPVKPSEVAN